MPAAEILNDDDYEDDMVCECEMDYNCGLHRNGPTFLEARYQGLDAEEAMAFGRPWDA